MSSRRSGNINNDFFSGLYKDVWRSFIPEALTKAEIEFIIQESELQRGSKVLDLMCGYGRHSLELARRGIAVTAVDNLADYVDEIKEIAFQENLPITCIQTDVLEFKSTETFDLVICMGNNLSFFNKKDTESLFSRIAICTKPGKKFISNSWMIAEIVFKNFTLKSWSDINEFRYLYESKFLFNPTRIETKTRISSTIKPEEVKDTVDYIYSLNETENMLSESGFVVQEIWSIPGKKKFSLGEPRAYIVAERI